jgi:hypothetical protein
MLLSFSALAVTGYIRHIPVRNPEVEDRVRPALILGAHANESRDPQSESALLKLLNRQEWRRLRHRRLEALLRRGNSTVGRRAEKGRYENRRRACGKIGKRLQHLRCELIREKRCASRLNGRHEASSSTRKRQPP